MILINTNEGLLWGATCRGSIAVRKGTICSLFLGQVVMGVHCSKKNSG